MDAAYGKTFWAGQAALPLNSGLQQQFDGNQWRLLQPMAAAAAAAAMSTHLPLAYDASYSPYTTANIPISISDVAGYLAADYGTQQCSFTTNLNAAGDDCKGMYDSENGTGESGDGSDSNPTGPVQNGMQHNRTTSSSGSSVNAVPYGAAATGTRAQTQQQQKQQISAGPSGGRPGAFGSPAAASGGAATAAAAQGLSSSLPGAHVGRVKEGALVNRKSMEQMARSAAVWVVYYNYAVTGPSDTPVVLTPEQLVQAYANRRVHGYTFVVGLAEDAKQLLTEIPSVGGSAASSEAGGGGAGAGSSLSGRSAVAPVPPAYLRPLVFHLALAHAGVPYTPITRECLTAGLPPPGWCLPGSLLQPKTMAAATAAAAARGQPLARWDPLKVDAAVRQLLAHAPYWSLLNAYGDSGRWNCSQNLTIAQLRQRLPAGHGCLHACVLGSTEPLPQGVWIPTSMVLPLAVLLQAMAADDGRGEGLYYVPPSVADVRYYIEDAVRAVRGRPEASARLEAHLQRLREPAASVAPGAACGMMRVRLDPGAAEFIPTFLARATSAASSSRSGDTPENGGAAAGFAAASTAQAPSASQAGKAEESMHSAAVAVEQNPQDEPAECPWPQAMPRWTRRWRHRTSNPDNSGGSPRWHPVRCLT
ncbi:hypothetical protein Vretimale_13664 [Volvox reticuliferus]|uniref:Uncharacterized protein n=1 Tax=Volvox reticuliferus TaxID=1737510 RepID=A0A8J4GKN0_9CHLO|nr:hypothetical protein Vretimale_13664 [Volvox reticuliferus]